MRAIPLVLLAAAAALAGAAPAFAQSDILLRLRSGSPAGDRFRVDSAAGMVARGSLGVGIIPATGPGIRMMWYPNKAAFRAGSADGGLGNYWDDANVGFYSWAGGSQTVASGLWSFAMGELMNVTGNYAVGLGSAGTVSGEAGFSAGSANVCSGAYCTAIGVMASATGLGSVALGARVTANADNAVVLGRRASANGNAGSFTWTDASTTATFLNSAANSFQIRASGGVILYTNSGATAGVSLSAGGSSWNVVSDRGRKRDFARVDGEDVLARIRTLPVTTWAYVDEAGGIRHMGPMAQDWHAAFGFSPDETTINMSDLDGVNLAAVQALERRTADLQSGIAERDARIESLEARIADRDARIETMETRIARLEALLAAQAETP